MSDIVTHLRKWGLKVETKPGYEHRGRPYAFKPRAVVCHHTASSASGGNFASEAICTYGRTGLPGPLCQFLLGRDGTVKVIALGFANHAGTGGPYAGIPANTGNSYAYGIEAENNGLGEKWPPNQMQAYYRLCAALLDYMNVSDVSRVFGHKEWTSRKPDPAGIDMSAFRRNVKAALDTGPQIKAIKLKNITSKRYTVANRRVKWALKKRGFYNGRIDKVWGTEAKRAYAKFQRSLGYEGADADGRPGPSSLAALGFLVA